MSFLRRRRHADPQSVQFAEVAGDAAPGSPLDERLKLTLSLREARLAERFNNLADRLRGELTDSMRSLVSTHAQQVDRSFANDSERITRLAHALDEVNRRLDSIDAGHKVGEPAALAPGAVKAIARGLDAYIAVNLREALLAFPPVGGWHAQVLAACDMVLEEHRVLAEANGAKAVGPEPNMTAERAAKLAQDDFRAAEIERLRADWQRLQANPTVVPIPRRDLPRHYDGAEMRRIFEADDLPLADGRA